MKKCISIVTFMLMTQFLFSQTTFKYVIIPVKFPEISSGLNPYGISSEILRILNSKAIQCVFEADQKPNDYCDALTIHLEKKPSMLRNKLKVDLTDCMNNVVWTAEGVGQSKDFAKGYAEALAEAMKNLSELPANSIPQRFRETPAAPAEKGTPVALEKRDIPVADKAAQPDKSPAGPELSDANGYKPQNLYWNTTYFVDVISDPAGKGIKIIILNSKPLNYKDFQEIGTMSPSGLENVYNLKWISPEGKTIDGIAKLSEQQLNISLNSDKDQIVINLQKY